MEVAKEYFQWYKVHSQVKSYAPHRLISALYVPSKKKIYVASIPRGTLARTITCNAKEAPNWFNQIEPMWDSETPSRPKWNFWHAQDHAYWLYENIDNGKAEISNGRYPAGSIMATYGIQGFRAEGPVPLCSSQQQRTVSCQAVARGLGVAFTQPPNPAAVAQEWDDQMLDDDPELEAAMRELSDQVDTSLVAPSGGDSGVKRDTIIPKQKRADDASPPLSHPQVRMAIRTRFARTRQTGTKLAASEAKSVPQPSRSIEAESSYEPAGSVSASAAGPSSNARARNSKDVASKSRTSNKIIAAAAPTTESASACAMIVTNMQLNPVPLPFTLAPSLLASSSRSSSATPASRSSTRNGVAASTATKKLTTSSAKKGGFTTATIKKSATSSPKADAPRRSIRTF